MTYLELVQALHREAGVAGTAPSTVAGQTHEYRRLVEWIARAWIDIQSKHRAWSFLWDTFSVPTLAVQSDYTVPNSREVLHDTVRLDNRPQRFVHWEDLRAIPSVPLRGVFTELPNRSLRLLVPENGTLTGEHYRTPQTLTADGDTPSAPDHLHMVIVYKAMVYYASFEEAPGIYQDAVSNLRLWTTRLQQECLPDVLPPGPLA